MSHCEAEPAALLWPASPPASPWRTSEAILAASLKQPQVSPLRGGVPHEVRKELTGQKATGFRPIEQVDLQRTLRIQG